MTDKATPTERDYALADEIISIKPSFAAWRTTLTTLIAADRMEDFAAAILYAMRI